MDVHGPLGPLRHSLNLVGLTDDDSGQPASAVQYAVRTPNGGHVVFGDQEWVQSGKALGELPEGSTVRKRTIDISYGQWEDV